IFSTLYTTNDGYHPVSGNRKFGFINNGDGTFTFYTQGEDRLSPAFYKWGNWLRKGIAFKTADKLWMSFIQKSADDFGSNVVLDSTTYRPNYEKVDEVLNGTKKASTLGCN